MDNTRFYHLKWIKNRRKGVNNLITHQPLLPFSLSTKIDDESENPGPTCINPV